MGFSRLGRIVFLVLGTVLFGAAGFKILPGGENWTFLDSLYMAVITLSSVGFREVHALTEAPNLDHSHHFLRDWNCAVCFHSGNAIVSQF